MTTLSCRRLLLYLKILLVLAHLLVHSTQSFLHQRTTRRTRVVGTENNNNNNDHYNNNDRYNSHPCYGSRYFHYNALYSSSRLSPDGDGKTTIHYSNHNHSQTHHRSSSSSSVCVLLTTHHELIVEKTRSLAQDLHLPLVSLLHTKEESVVVEWEDYQQALLLLPYHYTHSSSQVDAQLSVSWNDWKEHDDEGEWKEQNYAVCLQSLTPADRKKLRKIAQRRRQQQQQQQQQQQASDTTTTTTTTTTTILLPLFAMKPTFVDFCRAPIRPGKDLLLQAAALRPGWRVYDLTAGLAQDSLLLAYASATAQVTMVERDPIVYTLLKDAMRRLQVVAASSSSSSANTNVENGNSLMSRQRTTAQRLLPMLQLIHGDGTDMARRQATQKAHDSNNNNNTLLVSLPHVVYLDPMFPPRGKKSASVKKNMQVLHQLFLLDYSQAANELLEEENRLAQESNLLQAALQLAQVRVVCKRPIHAPPLGSRANSNNKKKKKEEEEEEEEDTDDDVRVVQPSYAVSGSVNRWDVYLIAKQK